MVIGIEIFAESDASSLYRWETIAMTRGSEIVQVQTSKICRNELVPIILYFESIRIFPV